MTFEFDDGSANDDGSATDGGAGQTSLYWDDPLGGITPSGTPPGYLDPDGFWVHPPGSFTPSGTSSMPINWDGFFKGVGDIFKGTSGFGPLGQLAAYGGVAALLNKLLGESGESNQPTGYQGDIPVYTASRQQYAFAPSAQRGPVTDANIRQYLSQPGLTDPMIAQNMAYHGITPERMAGITSLPSSQVQQRYNAAFGPNISEGTRRPGQGGVTYFSPIQYSLAPRRTDTTTTGGTTTGGTTTGGSTTGGSTTGGSTTGGSTTGGSSNVNNINRPPATNTVSAPPSYNANVVGTSLAQNYPPAAANEINTALTLAWSRGDYDQVRRVASNSGVAISELPALLGISATQVASALNPQTQTQTQTPRRVRGYAEPVTIQYGANGLPGAAPAIANDPRYTNIEGGYYGFEPAYLKPSGTTYFGDQLIPAGQLTGLNNVIDVLNFGLKDRASWDPSKKYIMATPGYREGAVDPATRRALNIDYAPGGYQFQWDPETKDWFASGYVDPGTGKGYIVDRFGNALERPVDFLINPLIGIPTYEWANEESKNYFPSSIYSYGTSASSEEPQRKSSIVSHVPGGMAAGGIAALPASATATAAAKGRFIQGPGDGVSDHVPATINGTQPARLADGEFVFPARIVSELGNGSSAAGARKLYAFMDRVERMAKAAKRGKPSGADKLLNKLA